MNFTGLAGRGGVDLDPRVETNPMLDEGRVADAGDIPYSDNMFDPAFSDNVVENLDDPAAVFSEVVRDLQRHPERLSTVPAEFAKRLLQLVADARIDLDAPLDPADD